MDKIHIRQKVILSAVAGVIMIPGSAINVCAAENNEEQPFIQTSGIESVLEECYETEVRLIGIGIIFIFFYPNI